jgi:hypothetical protein
MTDPERVIRHLRQRCVPNPVTKSDAELLADWKAAQEKLGAPVQNAGFPDIQDLPGEAEGYLGHLTQAPWYLEELRQFPRGAEPKFVEIDKLLAFSFSLDSTRADHHCEGVSRPPAFDETLRLCLPLRPPQENVTVHVLPEIGKWENSAYPKSAMIVAKGTNLRIGPQGVFNDAENNPQTVGLRLGFGQPGVQVRRLNGRCYLSNGYHRALGLRKAGATHMPCTLVDVASEAEIGIVPGGTFEGALLASPNPPALEHFTQGRALDVQIRAQRSILNVSWSLHLTNDE